MAVETTVLRALAITLLAIARHRHQIHSRELRVASHSTGDSLAVQWPGQAYIAQH